MNDRRNEPATKRDVEQVQQNVSNVRGELGQVQTELGQVRGELGQVQTELGQVHGELGQVQTELGQLRGELNQVQSELGQVQTELGQVHGELGQVQTELGQFRGEFDQVKQELSTKIEANTAKIDAVERRLTAKLDRVARQVIDNSIRLDQMVTRDEFNKRMDEVIAGQDKMISLFTRLDQERTVTTARLDRVEAEVDKNKRDIKQIKTKLALP